LTLSGIHDGDVVRVAGSLAFVVGEPKAGRLMIRWANSHSTRYVKAREVEAHWKRTKK
jgi:hypothetical protein